MKKVLFGIFCILFTATLSAQEIKITNSFGGDSDNMAGQDFLSFPYNAGMLFSDRLQISCKSKFLEGKVRFDIWNTENSINEEAALSPSMQLKGFGKVNFGDYISLVAGNSYFSTFDIKAAELFANDTIPNYGKVIKSGLSLYSEIPFDKKGKTKLKLGTGIEYDTLLDSFETIDLDFGADFIYKNKIYSGISLRSIPAGAFGKYSAFVGGKFNDLRINGGFIYNNTDEDILPNEAKYSASLSGRYKIDKLGLSIAADAVSGLNSQYLSSKKEKTKTYKNNAIPFMTSVNIESEPGENLTVGLNVAYRKMLRITDSSTTTIYPYVSYCFNDEKYEISSGTRLELDRNTGNGITKVSFPVLFKVEF